jgi:ATP dependent DNA ligase-like protein
VRAGEFVPPSHFVRKLEPNGAQARHQSEPGAGTYRCSGPWFVGESFEDGAALFTAVCAQGLEGVVAKCRSSIYAPGERRWIKTKNRNYWRFGEEVESLRRSLERRRLIHH